MVPRLAISTPSTRPNAGLELADAEGRVIAIDAECVHAEPRDLNVLPENESRKDARTLDKLIDGKNQGEEKHSWLAPFTIGALTQDWGGKGPRGSIAMGTRQPRWHDEGAD